MGSGKDYRHIKSSLGNLAGAGLLQGEGDQLEKTVGYNFFTGIVNDVISNPYIYLRNKIAADPSISVSDLLSGKKKIKDINIRIQNKDLIPTAPLNSIIAQIINPQQSSKDGALPILCYPFFPPHISLPLNPSEYVWILECDVKGSKMYYWMCRQVGPLEVDDINFTNMERLIATSDIVDNFVKKQGANPPNEDMLKNALTLDNGMKTNSNIVLSKLFANSYAYRGEFTGEPVPRLAKNCGDLLLQGSNNAGIHLTTEKFSPTEEADIKSKKYTGKLLESDSSLARKPDAAAIDIYVKRKKKDLDAITEIGLFGSEEKFDTINTVKNDCSNDFYTYIENDKLATMRYQDDSVYDKELIDGKDDALNIGARVYLSHHCNIDDTFDIKFDDLSKNQKLGPSILTYAMHNRVIGEDDVRVISRLGESFIDLDEKGNITAKASKTQGQQFLRLEPGAQGNTTLNANGTIYLQDKALQSFVRAEDLAIELTKLKAALTSMATALQGGGFCPFPAGPNAVLATAMSGLQTALSTPGTEPDFNPTTAPWVSKKIKGE